MVAIGHQSLAIEAQCPRLVEQIGLCIHGKIYEIEWVVNYPNRLWRELKVVIDVTVLPKTSWIHITLPVIFG